MITLMVNLVGLLLMAGIVWWFWLYHRAPAALAEGGAIQITVEHGVYVPDRVRIPVNKPTTLRFLRKDPSSCAAMVVFDGLGLSAALPVGEVTEVVVAPSKAGEYRFSCQMQMYRGTLDVFDS